MSARPGLLGAGRRILRQWLALQRSRGHGPWEALLWRLPARGIAHARAAGGTALHRLDARVVRPSAYRDSILAAAGRSRTQPHFVVVVPGLLHLLIPCLRMATRHVPVVLVLNGVPPWEQAMLDAEFADLPRVRVWTPPGSMIPHGLVIALLLEHAGRDFVLHDPDLYVFDPSLYRELELSPGELAAGPFGYLNLRSGKTFLRTPLLALRWETMRSVLERHRIGPELRRRTPARLAEPLRSIGIGDDNFPKSYLSYYDPLDLAMAMGIHDGYALREVEDGDDRVFHVGGVSYLDENYRLDYLNARFLDLAGSSAFAERYRGRLAARSMTDLRARFLADGAAAALARIDALIDRVASELTRR